MTDPADIRHDPPPAADEATQLHGFLDYQRATLLMKAADLSAEQLAQSHPPSTMTIGGLLKHMALVEDNWFSVFLHGNEEAQPWRDVDWDADRDWEWHTAAADDPDELRALLVESMERSRQLVAGKDLDSLSARKLHHEGVPASLRWISLHMVEEYARHNGHADLLRESIDGLTGE